MKIIVQPDKFTCLPASFAMVTSGRIEDYLKGHQREYALPECTEVAYGLGYFCHEFPNGFTINKNTVIAPNIDKIKNMMWRSDGVILGEINGGNHAVAWFDGEILDPKGYKSKLENYNVHSFILVQRY